MEQPGGVAENAPKKDTDRESSGTPGPDLRSAPDLGSEERSPHIQEDGEHREDINAVNNEKNGSHSDGKARRTKKSVRWSEDLVMESPSPRSSDGNGGPNPYVTFSPAPSNSPSNFKNTMHDVKDILGRWGKKVGEVTRKAEDLAGNTWQHLKTSPSFADAALGRIAQGTKVLAEGGYEKIFRNTFETVPEEKLKNSYACYLSTSAGPVMGILYVSTAKLAFCSDNPLSYKAGDDTEWSYYKVVIPLHQLKAVNPTSSRTNAAEKYIQVISADNHEFWFVGFVKYNGAVKYLQEILQAQSAVSLK